MVAAVALIDVAAASSGPANRDGRQDPTSRSRDPATTTLAKAIAVTADDVGHLYVATPHRPNSRSGAGRVGQVEWAARPEDLAHRHTGVDLGRGETAVTEQDLDRAHARTGVEQVGREGVSQ